MKHTKNFYDGDFEIERFFAESTLYHDRKFSGKELDIAMFDAISKSRELGLTEEEIECSIRLNLRTYGYADDTFPVERWMIVVG